VEKNFQKFFEEAYYKRIAMKLGIEHHDFLLIKSTVDSLMNLMNDCNSDFTSVFRILTDL
jgi:uncharacterized protein YdiU (UPF0061 family)